MKKSFLIVVGLVFSLAWCQKTSVDETAINDSTWTEVTQPTGLANPASENCIKQGWTLKILESKRGQYWVCYFEDNRQCEEWALLRGDCPVGGKKVTWYENEAEVFCAISGGEVQGLGTDVPMCKRADGTLCNAQANFDGDCPNPYDLNPSAGNVEAE